MNTYFVSPLAYDLLSQYGTNKIIENDQDSLRMNFLKSLFLRIEGNHASGLEGYLETKTVEFVQFMILQRAFAQVDISIDFSMAYFDHDFHNGIDGFMKHKDNRIGVDLTHLRHIPSKIHNQSRIKEDYERSIHIQGKKGSMPHNYGRVLVGFSTRLYDLSRTIVSSSDCVEDVVMKIQKIQQLPGLNETKIIGLNKKGDNWISKGYPSLKAWGLPVLVYSKYLFSF